MMRPPPAAKPRTTLIIVASVVGGVLFLGCAMGAVFYLAFVHEFEEPMTQADRDVLLTPDKLTEFVELEFDPAIGKAKRVRYLDGSRELSYEYESPDGAEDPLYVLSSVNLERNVSDAHFVYMGANLGLKLGMALEGEEGLQEVARPGLFQWGDESRAVVLMRDDKPVGNVFAGRKGKRVFHILLVGVYFDEHGQVEAALGPVLRRFEAYNP
jgi:hypothetical protein